MLYEVKLSSNELDWLSSLIGQKLIHLSGDGWCAQLWTPQLTLLIEPDEVATPDQTHQNADVDRVSVEWLEKPTSYEKNTVLKEDCGLIQEIRIISTLISFSPPIMCPSLELLPGVFLSEGIGYDRIHHHPSTKEILIDSIDNDHAIVEYDIAIELMTEAYPSIVFYTRGYFIHVSLAGMPQDQSWLQFQNYSRRLLASCSLP